ncbi:hypothetical protein AAFF_G00260740 [Aldrovandia affinis]|uniref:Uncharacterized protein n=1 Tax=Aldrovandia affinis TaxID=143900 RepID=A0AAD7REN2_9TELE|nr:hypothetical protein AAFF_G00260740 [Aldrovandia affinis]
MHADSICCFTDCCHNSLCVAGRLSHPALLCHAPHGRQPPGGALVQTSTPPTPFLLYKDGRIEPSSQDNKYQGRVFLVGLGSGVGAEGATCPSV